MLRILCFMLNGILVVAGFWAFIKLNWCEATAGVCIGLFNIIVLMQELRRGPAVTVSAVASLIAIVWGVIATSRSFSLLSDAIDKDNADMWTMFDAGYSVSYGFAYIGAGLLTIFTFVRYPDSGSSSDAVESQSEA